MSFVNCGAILKASRVGLTAFLLCVACDRSGSSKDVPPPPPTKTPAPAPRPPLEDDRVVPPSRQGDPKSASEPELVVARFGGSAKKPFRDAFSRFQKWVRAENGKIYAALVDLETDEWLLQSRQDEAVNVASNAKLVTAAAALELLGPAYTFQTELFGDLGEGGQVSRLVLRGGGAPDLDVADLWRLLAVVRGMGLTEVKEIVVDQSRFSDDYVPPAYDQQPQEWAPFRANIAALSLNENAVELNVVSQRAGQPARVFYVPEGVVQPQGTVLSGESGTGDRVTWTLDPGPDRAHMVSRVGGSLAAGLGRRRYARRLEDPRLAAGFSFQRLLVDAGIEVKEKPVLGKRAGEKRLTLWPSAPLAELLRELGKNSNNFYAEMLLVALSAAREVTEQEAEKEPGRKEPGDSADSLGSAGSADSADIPWSSALGAQVVASYLKSKGVDMQGIVVKNGSGLFDANRYSAKSLVQVLAAMEDNPKIFQDYVSHLAMGGVDGTLQKRMSHDPLGGRIRAKTGTLRSFIALSGYIGRTGGRSPAAFSVIVEGIAGQHGTVRSKLDAMVLEWARVLNDPAP